MNTPSATPSAAWCTDDGRFYLERQETVDGSSVWGVVAQRTDDHILLKDLDVPLVKARSGRNIQTLDKGLRNSVRMLAELTGCSGRLVRKPTTANALSHQYVIVGTGLNLVKDQSGQWHIGKVSGITAPVSTPTIMCMHNFTNAGSRHGKQRSWLLVNVPSRLKPVFNRLLSQSLYGNCRGTEKQRKRAVKRRIALHGS